jgi:hypothetical protein
MSKIKPKFKRGDKITFTVVDTAPGFYIMTLRNDVTKEEYVCDIGGGGPYAWQPEWEKDD